MVKNLTFDIMVGDRFFYTMRTPMTLDVVVGYDGDKPIVDGNKLTECVTRKFPSLKHKDFRICF